MSKTSMMCKQCTRFGPQKSPAPATRVHAQLRHKVNADPLLLCRCGSGQTTIPWRQRARKTSIHTPQRCGRNYAQCLAAQVVSDLTER